MHDNWEELEKSIIDCRKCRLCENRTNIVFGEGQKQAKVMFIFYFLEEVKTKHYFGRKTCLAPGYLIKFNRSIKLYKIIIEIY